MLNIRLDEVRNVFVLEPADGLTARVFAPPAPGQVHVFADGEPDEARKWIAAEG